MASSARRPKFVRWLSRREREERGEGGEEKGERIEKMREEGKR
jgi:hypothetical protein